MIIYTKCIITNDMGYFAWTIIDFCNITNHFGKGCYKTSNIHTLYKILLIRILDYLKHDTNHKVYIVINNKRMIKNFKKQIHSDTLRWNIIDILMHDNIEFRYSNGSGDRPMFENNIYDFLNYAEGKFLGLKINTNASMLNEKLIHALLSSDLQTIVFSIDAKDKESYEKIRVNGSFEKTIKNLELFNKIRNTKYRREDKIVRISGVKINDKQNIEEMKKKWGDVADIIAFTNYTPWESSYENDENNILDPCSELWTRLFVWWDGKINPCDYDYKSLLSKWNIKDAKINEIWNSKYYNNLRNNHLKRLRNNLEPCKRCINT